MFKPVSLTVTEHDPSSVASYNLQVRSDDQVTVLANQTGIAADPSGVTVISLQTILGAHPTLVGQSVRFYVQEVGPHGDVADWQQANDATGHGAFVIEMTPNGAESIVVNL